MKDLIEILESFNRKERFHLVKMALGSFRVSDEFKMKLKLEDIDIPDKHFAAMDYHLDWIYASLFCCFDGSNNQAPLKNDGRIKGSQEDVDFLIAYQDSQDRYHLIFLEAKGVTPWDNEQLRSKCARLEEIFERKDDKWKEKVILHSFILSPKEPENLDPSFKYFRDWIKIDIHPQNLKKVVRCSERGRETKNGVYWKIEDEYPYN